MRRQPQRLIFLDETGTDTGVTREYGRSPGGERLKGSAPFRRWGNRTLIAGLSCDGIVAPRVISGALDRDAFDSCIEKVPIPELNPGSVVILDNLATRNSDTATRMLKAHGCHFLFLPACSPDLNRIEMAFSKLQPEIKPSCRGLFYVLSGPRRAAESALEPFCEGGLIRGGGRSA